MRQPIIICNFLRCLLSLVLNVLPCYTAMEVEMMAVQVHVRKDVRVVDICALRRSELYLSMGFYPLDPSGFSRAFM